MSRLRQIEDTINSTISNYAHIKIMPRGLPYYVDSLLRGTVRFAKRTGSNIAMIRPDNTYKISTTVSQSSRQVFLSHETPWIGLDALVSLGPEKELQVVSDIIGNQIVLAEPTNRSFSTSDKLLLYATPLEAAITTPAGADMISVRTHYPLFNGDIFGYLATPGFIQSFTEIKIEQAIIGGTTTDPYYSQLYQVKLSEPIGRQLETNELVYIRAYPAYSSQTVRVPNSILSPEPLGPFLIDHLGGNLLEGDKFEETLSIKTLSRGGSYIAGTPYSFDTVENNHLVLDRPLAAHSPLFWDLAEGTMRFTPSRVLFRVNENSKFAAGFKCVPVLDGNHSWRINIKSNETCTIRFIFYPNAPQEFTIPAGNSITAIVSIPAGTEPVDRVEINIAAETNIAEIALSDWSPITNFVDQIQYALVIKATGLASYLSSGLILKPYFLTSDLLKSRYDQDANYDGGKVYF